MKLYCTVFLIFFLSVIANAQDQIVKTNGDEIFGKVIRVNPAEIVYKKKDNMDGPEYSELKSNILFIKYENGTKEIFTTANTPVINNVSSLCAPIKRKNSVFFEAGGNGIIASLNYERRFFRTKGNNFLAVKAGFGPFAIINVGNITATYNIGDGMNFFEIGVGAGGIFQSKNSSFLSQNSFAYFSPTLGYRRQSGGGFMFRAFITMLTMQEITTAGGNYQNQYDNYIYAPYTTIITNKYYPFLGFSIGYSF
jgi:hypothetical protein